MRVWPPEQVAAAGGARLIAPPPVRTVASRANFNTEIGLPLEILGAPPETEILVLEMAMRGVGQIAELAAIAGPDVGVIVSVGPVHLELLGTVEAVAATKAELIAALPAGGTAVVPAGEARLTPYLRDDLDVVTFGEGADVRLLRSTDDHVEIDVRGRVIGLTVPFARAAALVRELLAAGDVVLVKGSRGVGLELVCRALGSGVAA
jgi:UDP-N-acetylmuramoyl-tripeptide--D-alanyl-D-alanine ligase